MCLGLDLKALAGQNALQPFSEQAVVINHHYACHHAHSSLPRGGHFLTHSLIFYSLVSDLSVNTGAIGLNGVAYPNRWMGAAPPDWSQSFSHPPPFL